jgi:hypothetical protein
MADMSAFSAAMASLRLAGDITKAMITLRDGQMIQAKVIELQGVILAAQQSALSAQSDQFTLLERVREFEKQVADLEEWNTQKQRYTLMNVGDGVVAYALKPDADPPEPFHLLCAKCFHYHKRSFLQATQKLEMRRRVHRCAECKSEYAFSHVAPPTQPPAVRRNPLPSA